MIARTLDYLRALADNRRRHPGQPRFLTYIVTFTCNARCIMCDSWKKPSPNDLSLEEIERDLIQLAIETYEGRMSEVARRLGMGRSTLYRKIRDHGLEVKRAS